MEIMETIWKLGLNSLLRHAVPNAVLFSKDTRGEIMNAKVFVSNNLR